jgi:alpha-L-rhamnosidase
VWANVTAITPRDLYLAYGDIRVLRDQYESMTARLDTDVIRNLGTRLWGRETFQFGDWLHPKASPDDPGAGRTDNQLVASAYLVHVTSIVADISEVLGESAPSDIAPRLSRRSARRFFAST